MNRSFTISLAVLACPIAFVNGVVILQAILSRINRDSWSDWFIILLPIVITFLCWALSIAVLLVAAYRSKTCRKAHSGRWGEIGRAALVGAFYGGLPFLLMQTTLTVPSFQEMSKDGLAYWAAAFLPAFWIGLPLILVGSITGTIRAAIMSKKQNI